MYQHKKKSQATQSTPLPAAKKPKLTPEQQAVQRTKAESLTIKRRKQAWMSGFKQTVTPQREALTPVLIAGKFRTEHEQAIQHEKQSAQTELSTTQAALPAPEVVQRIQASSEHQNVPPVQRTRDGRLFIPTMQAATQLFYEQISVQRKKSPNGSVPLGHWQSAARQTTAALINLYQTSKAAAAERQQELAASLAGISDEHDRSRLASMTLSQIKPAVDGPVIQRMLDERITEQSQKDGILSNLTTVQRLQAQLSDLEQEASIQSGPALTKRIEARRGQGFTLPVAVQRQLEQGLNTDLSGVRIHADQEADKLSKSVGAVAFTTGTDIFFQSNKYDPHSTEGFKLLAHETTHVKQQMQGRASAGIDADAGLEAEAQRAETKLSNLKPASKKVEPKRFGTKLPRQTLRVTGALQRQADAAAINKAITLPPGQQPEQSWLQKLGQAAWKAVYEQPIYQAGVLAGVVEGFFVDIWENLKALGAVATQAYQMIQEIFTCQITGRIQGITSWLKNLSWDAIRQIAESLGGQLKAQILGQVKAWTQPDPFQRGRAQGKIVGMILAEVGIAYITAGTVTTVKNSLVASGKVAQIVSKIPGAANLIAGVTKKQEAFKVLAATAKTATTKAVKSLIPEAWLKRLGAKGTAQAEKALASADAQAALKQGGQKAKELPVAVALAVATVSANDVMDSPTAIVIKELELLKSRFKWIKGFEAAKSGAGLSFYLIASRINIYNGYTNKNKPDKEFEVIPYGMNLSDVNKTRKANGLLPLEKHHGVMDEWAKIHLGPRGYVSGHAPTLTLTEAQHEATKEVYREWLRRNYGSPVGVSPDWRNMTPQEAQKLTNDMLIAAGVPDSARRDYFRAWNLYIYTKVK